MIVVIAGALDLHRLAIEEEALVRIKNRGAHAKAHSLRIANFFADFDACNRRIKIWLIHRPECRIG